MSKIISTLSKMWLKVVKYPLRKTAYFNSTVTQNFEQSLLFTLFSQRKRSLSKIVHYFDKMMYNHKKRI